MVCCLPARGGWCGCGGSPGSSVWGLCVEQVAWGACSVLMHSQRPGCAQAHTGTSAVPWNAGKVRREVLTAGLPGAWVQAGELLGAWVQVSHCPFSA